MTRKLDQFGWFIVNMHKLIGHDKTAGLIGEPPGDHDRCLICQYESEPTAERKKAVIDAMGRETPGQPEQP